MNHHEAQVIADSYRTQVAEIWNQHVEADEDRLQVARVRAMEDHSAVWQRVADALPREDGRLAQAEALLREANSSLVDYHRDRMGPNDHDQSDLSDRIDAFLKEAPMLRDKEIPLTMAAWCFAGILVCLLIQGGRYIEAHIEAVRAGIDCADQAREKGWVK